MKLKGNRSKIATLGIGLTTVTTLFLSGCGGDGGGGGGSSTPAASGLSGVAAVGSPIAGGTISVVCSGGSALDRATTSSTGVWQVTLSGQTLPCAVEVSGGTINGTANTTTYHSIATAAGTVNVTPLTDLIVANLASTATPGTWFAGLNASPSKLSSISQTTVDDALTKLRTALNGLPQLSANNPITMEFSATPGTAGDDMLTALKTAMNSTGVPYTSLLASASGPNFIAPVVGFDTALTSAYADAARGGTTSSTAGSTTGSTATSTTGGATTSASTAACSSTVAPAGMTYSQTGNTLTATTNGCISVPTAGICTPSAPSATGTNVLVTSTAQSFQMSGIKFNVAGMSNPFDALGSAYAGGKACVQNAPTEFSNLNINYNVCYDISSQMASSVAQMQSSGMITVSNPITISAQGAATMQTVADCTTSGADTITDAFTGKMSVKQTNGSYSQIN